MAIKNVTETPKGFIYNARTILCKPEELEATKLYAATMAKFGILRLVFLESEETLASELDSARDIICRNGGKLKPIPK